MVTIICRLSAWWGVYYKVYFTIKHSITYVRWSLTYFANGFYGNMFLNSFCSSMGCCKLESHICCIFNYVLDTVLVCILNTYEHFSPFWKFHACWKLCLVIRNSEVVIYSHTFPCGLHLRSKYWVCLRNLDEGEYWFFNCNVFDFNFIPESEVTEFFTHHEHGCNFCKWHSYRFAHEWNCTACTWVGLNDVNCVFSILFRLDSVLDVHKSNNVQFKGKLSCVVIDGLDNLFRYALWWYNTCRISWMNSCFLNVFHYPSNEDLFSITECVNIYFDCIFKELINEYGMFWWYLHGFFHVLPELIVIVNDLHGPST